MGAALVAGALFLLPAGLGIVSPRSRHAVELPGEQVLPECEPPPSRLATPRPACADDCSSERETPARETAREAVDAGGEPCAPPAASTEHAPELARLELRVHGIPAGEDGATLEILHEPGGGATARRTLHRSDASGQLVLELVPGSVRAVAWSSQATAAPVRGDLLPTAQTTLELELEPALPVLGRVVEADTGAPVSGASVSLWSFAECDSVTTGADGTFRHPRFPTGAPAQQLAARASGYGTSVRYLRLASDGSWKLLARHDGEASVRGTGTPWVDLELVREHRVAGRVVDPSGAPLAGARITIEGFQRVLASVAARDAAQAECAPDGRFELGGLRSDLGHALTIEARGFAFEPLELGPTAGRVELGTLTLAPATFLTGVVLDAQGLPVADAEVVLRLAGTPPARAAVLDAGARVQGHERRGLTSSAGTFFLEDLWPAEVWLTVETDEGAHAEALLGPRGDGTFETPCLTLAPASALAQGAP